MGISLKNIFTILLVLPTAMTDEFKHWSDKNDASFGTSDSSERQKRAANCNPNGKYRSIDGSCNNIVHPEWGKTLQPFQRLLKPAYDDGKCQPRLFQGMSHPLPSARKVFTACIARQSKRTAQPGLTQVVQNWGLHVIRDISFTTAENATNSCALINADGTHPDYSTCGPLFPIQIPAGDRTFTNCMEFIRSVSSQDSRGIRQQLNANTAFIDASQTYGSSAAQLGILRENVGGRLKMPDDFLPVDAASQPCVLKSPATACFVSGETRTNIVSGSNAFQTIISRQHNKIADQLAAINPGWNDEKIFQETRKIIIAYTQHITYTAWLPKMIGWFAMRKFGLRSRYSYSENTNPNILNSFSTAAGRAGHSIVTQTYPTFTSNNTQLEDTYFRPHLMLEGGKTGIDKVTHGLLCTRSQRPDKYFAPGLTDKLLENILAPGLSLDLVSLNIQRGRDHGLPSYKDFVRFCKTYRMHSRTRTTRRCASVYWWNIRNVDLFVGGLHEANVRGGLLGSTFACITALQFQKLRNGDRFFYETNDSDIGFTKAQLAEIKRITLSRIICDNTNLTELQQDAFMEPSYRNRMTECSKLPKVDLEKWRE